MAQNKNPQSNPQTIKDNKKLPRQEDGLAPFEIVEPGQEPPKKLNLEDAISTLPEEEKIER